MPKLRFRAWNKVKQEMLYDGFVIRAGNAPKWDSKSCKFIEPYIWQEGTMGTELLESPTLEQEHDIENIMNPGAPFGCSYELIDWSSFYSLENLIVMQSTGLLDKNGKEIFEKDVLAYEDITEPVEWNGYCFIWYGKVLVNIDTGHGTILSTKLEIVGNIFEDKNETK